MRGKITVRQLERMLHDHADNIPKVLFTHGAGTEFATPIKVEIATPASKKQRIAGAKPQDYRKVTVEFDPPEIVTRKRKQGRASGWLLVTDELITNSA